MSLLFSIVNLVLLVLSIILLIYLQRKNVAFNKRALVALVIGIIIGFFINYTQGSEINNNKSLVFYSLEVYRVVSSIYINLLQALVYPLIVVSILTAITKASNGSDLGKYGVSIILILLLIVSIASLTSMIVMHFFNLTHEVSTPYDTFNNVLSHKIDKLPNNVADMIINFIPINPFLDLTGVRSTSTIATVIFTIIIGIAYFSMKDKYFKESEAFKSFINVAYILVTRIVFLILRLTPYGILALIARVIAISDVLSLLSLLSFIVCLIIAIIILFIIETIIITLFGYNPKTYYIKVFPLLTFAFFSRSSAASIPIGIDTQTNKLGIPAQIANLSTTLGSTLGQVGCVGVYVTMVIFLTASAYNIDPWNLMFIIKTLCIVVVTSLGVAGVGGGAIYGAIIALGAFNFPLSVLGLLIPIDSILDMFRTSLNVNSLTVSSLITGKITKSNNKQIFDDKSNINESN